MFKGAGMGNMMKQAQQMQDQMQELQEKIAVSEVEGVSGAGMIKVRMNGRHDVKNVSIDSEVLKEDKDILEDLIAAAVNDAVRKLERQQKEKMESLATELGLPAGLKLPF